MTRQAQIQNKGEGHRKRLRERFMKGGLNGFHDYEVLELLLSLNTPRKDCKASAKLLLEEFKTFPGVLEASTDALCKVDGIGPANSIGIRLIKDVCDRYLESRILAQDVVDNQADLLSYLKQTMSHRTKEVFLAVFLDAKNKVITSDILFEGTLTQSSVYPREVIISALEKHAAAIIFAHNHPSGDVEPSSSDINITRKLFFALKFVGILLHEHMVVGKDAFYSFAAHGWLKKFSQEFENQV